MMVRTRWMFGFQRRLLRICECEIECPKPGPLPQTSQFEATMELLVVSRMVTVERSAMAKVSRNPA